MTPKAIIENIYEMVAELTYEAFLGSLHLQQWTSAPPAVDVQGIYSLLCIPISISRQLNQNLREGVLQLFLLHHEGQTQSMSASRDQYGDFENPHCTWLPQGLPEHPPPHDSNGSHQHTVRVNVATSHQRRVPGRHLELLH